MNSFFSFNKIQKNIFLIIGCWLPPEKRIAFARKIMALPESGAAAPQPYGSYTYVDQ